MLAVSAAVALGGCATSVTTSGSDRPSPQVVGYSATTATTAPSRSREARAEAVRLRQRTPLPPGCARLPKPPAGVRGLSTPALEALSPYVVDAKAFCVSALRPAALVGWVAHHEPAGSGSIESGSGSGGLVTVGIGWPGTRALPDLESEVTAVPYRHGSVARIDGLVAYSPRKPASESVPTDVTEAMIAVTPESGARVERWVRERSTLELLVSLVNRCDRSVYTVNPGGPEITTAMAREDVVLHFYTGGAARRRLAVAVNEHPLLGAGTGDVAVFVGRLHLPVLLDEDGRLAAEASRVTGVSLAR